jgi:hypothetical protein
VYRYLVFWQELKMNSLMPVSVSLEDESFEVNIYCNFYMKCLVWLVAFERTMKAIGTVCIVKM